MFSDGYFKICFLEDVDFRWILKEETGFESDEVSGGRYSMYITREIKNQGEIFFVKRFGGAMDKSIWVK